MTFFCFIFLSCQSDHDYWITPTGSQAWHDDRRKELNLIVMQSFYFWSAFSRAGTLEIFRLVASPQATFDFLVFSNWFCQIITLNRTCFASTISTVFECLQRSGNSSVSSSSAEGRLDEKRLHDLFNSLPIMLSSSWHGSKIIIVRPRNNVVPS